MLTRSNTHMALAKFAPQMISKLLIWLCFACGCAIYATPSYGAGLGKLTVFSALGQPLRAEIELTAANKEELDSLTTRLASVEAFRQANIEFNPALLQLHFVLDKEVATRPLIRISSTQSINEPFVDMLVELSWNNGRLVREYTFLLDPPELKSSMAEAIAPATVSIVSTTPEGTVVQIEKPPASSETVKEQAAASTQVKKPIERSTEVKSEKQITPEKSNGEENVADEIHVKYGDTLSKIAVQTKPDNVTLDQMLVALFENNGAAFSGKNMNRLRAGAIIKIPSADTINAIQPKDARRTVVAQTADFNAYREKLAGAVASTTNAPVKADEISENNGREAAGKITAKVEEKVPNKAESKDKLLLSKSSNSGAITGKPETNKTSTADAISRAAEEKIAKEKAVKEAESRANQLQKNVTDIQKTLETTNKTLADAQKAAEVKNAAQTASPPVTSTPVIPAPSDLIPPTTANPTPELGTPPVGEAVNPPVVSQPAPVTQPVPPVPGKSVPSKTEEPGFLDNLRENPIMFYGGAVGIVALLIYLIYTLSRKRRFQKFENSIITGGDLRANSIFGSTGGQSVDTNSVFNTSFSPSQYQPDANEVDPVAEADVYIAYGREAQAEEILKEALRVQPERQAIRLKLLEIYSNRNDAAAFETLAGEMYSMTNGQCEEWPRVVTMGLKLDPTNPLYSSAGEAAQTNAESDATPETGQISAMVEDLSISETPPAPVPASASASQNTPSKAAEVAAMSQTLDFDLSQPNSMQRTPEPEVKLDFNLDQPTTKSPISATDFKIEIPQATQQAPQPPAASQPIAPTVDISGIDLILDSDSDKSDEPRSESWQEMATKLDLAKAYLEIGDKEGAQELLQEVVVAGDREQTTRAKDMLAQI